VEAVLQRVPPRSLWQRGDPAMVVLDEPNSNLDAAGEQALADTIERARQQGVTVVVITQRPALLNIVDRVLILRAGRMEAFGPPEDVLRRLVAAAGGAPAAAKDAMASG
jgi:ATP-binding cassette, subfamily C, bacterial